MPRGGLMRCARHTVLHCGCWGWPLRTHDHEAGAHAAIFNGDRDPWRRRPMASLLGGRGIEVDPGRAKELDRAVRTGRRRAAREIVRRPAGEPAGELDGGSGPPAPAGRAAHRPPPAKRSKVARVELRREPRFVSQTRGCVGRVPGGIRLLKNDCPGKRSAADRENCV